MSTPEGPRADARVIELDPFEADPWDEDVDHVTSWLARVDDPAAEI